jgi:hypothetical protein
VAARAPRRTWGWDRLAPAPRINSLPEANPSLASSRFPPRRRRHFLFRSPSLTPDVAAFPCSSPSAAHARRHTAASPTVSCSLPHRVLDSDRPSSTTSVTIAPAKTTSGQASRRPVLLRPCFERVPCTPRRKLPRHRLLSRFAASTSTSPLVQGVAARLLSPARHPPSSTTVSYRLGKPRAPPPRAFKSPRMSPTPRTFSLVLPCQALRPCRRLHASARTHPTPSRTSTLPPAAPPLTCSTSPPEADAASRSPP